MFKIKLLISFLFLITTSLCFAQNKISVNISGEETANSGTYTYTANVEFRFATEGLLVDVIVYRKVTNFKITSYKYNGINATEVGVSFPIRIDNFTRKATADIQFYKGVTTYTAKNLQPNGSDYLSQSQLSSLFNTFGIDPNKRDCITCDAISEVKKLGIRAYNTKLESVEYLDQFSRINDEISDLIKAKAQAKIDKEKITSLKNEINALGTSNEDLINKKSLYNTLDILDKNNSYSNQISNIDTQMKRELEVENSEKLAQEQKNKVAEKIKITDNKRQSEVARLNNLRQQQQLELEQKKAEFQRKQQEQYQKIQAQIAENKRKSEAINQAADETGEQWANGNYIEGSKHLMNEFAKQGNKDGVIATAAVGVGLEIFSAIAKNKEAKRIAEQKRQAELQRQREIQRKQEAALKAQKQEFYSLANTIKQQKNAILKKRKSIADTRTSYELTYDVKTQNHEPIYFYFIEIKQGYDNYNENIHFPNTIEVDIHESPKVVFSPIIAVHPKSNGEFDFLKNILSDIESKFHTNPTSTYIVYNWESNYDLIDQHYNRNIQLVSNSYFELIFPDDLLIDLNNKKNQITGISYWGDKNKEHVSDFKDEAGNLNYWKEEDQKQEETSEELKPIKDNKATNYWGKVIKVKKEEQN
ncbi:MULTISPECIES: cell envelope integrity protein TolA [Winogradskyella]|uniref:cell envelope integrity protein TolA n=1 Tax=Winogradskyella TaxID=286104 RepID=UPI0015CEA6DF|nr:MULTISPECIES: cell envelope integrity protein TolA [Winogradskyella]QXP77808.1 cell envelope integrity protein TolA [Winogradskyella sp. HaHa_3_26]